VRADACFLLLLLILLIRFIRAAVDAVKICM